MIDTFGGVISDTREAGDLSTAMIEKIYAAAQPGAVFSAPVVSGQYTIITASEVAAAGGFGFGSGSGPSQASRSGASQASGESNASSQAAPVAGGGGGGGGGGSSGRPVAAIIIGPDGVRVQPVVDVTKIGLAAIGAWLSIALLLARRARAAK